MLKTLGQFIKDIAITLLKLIRTVLIYLFVAIIVLALISLLGSVLLQGNQTGQFYAQEKLLKDEGGEDKVVVAKLSGIIVSQASPSMFYSPADMITPAKISKVLAQAQADPLVKAVIFDLNSPGGSPVASDRIFEMITDFRQETNIPVVFLFGDMAASGGYFIASASDFIVANPATLTGSIGVILETYNLEGLYEKIGVYKNTFKQGEYKDLLNESRPITPEEALIIEALNENTYELFIDRVAKGRKLEEDQVRNLATGQIYSGRQAKDLQLVDSLGNLNEAIYQAKSLANLDRYQVVEYESTSFFQQFFGEIKSPFSPALLWQSFLTLPQSLYSQRY